MKRIALTTLGCKANWSDSEGLAQALARAGFAIVPFEDEADAYVVNTCAVTAYAGAQSRQMLRRAKRRSPGAIIVATGCYSQVAREKIATLEVVDAIFGTADRAMLVEYLCERLDADLYGDVIQAGSIGLFPKEAQSRARAFVKVQEGCDRRCAYCIVPRARGRSRSMPVEETVETLRGLSRHHGEVVLAGIDIGQYGRDLGDGTTLSGLISRLGSEDGLSRIRLSTLGPGQVDGEIVRLMNEGRLCRHAHLSIQSCSDSVLARMGRGYGARDVERTARLLGEGVPDIAITGDVIAGFPGESETEHLETMQVLGRLPLAGLHVFPFSRRRGTLAFKMGDQVPKDVRKRRAAEIRELAAELRMGYLERSVGRSFDVIVTSREALPDGTVEAIADTGVKMRLPSGRARYGVTARARITDVTSTEVIGVWE